MVCLINNRSMITTKSGSYFESKVRLERISEDGMQVKFNELYVVNSMSFTETEAKLNEKVSQYSQGEFDVLTEVRAKYKEIFFSGSEQDDLFYKVKVDFVTLDERTEKQKHSKVDYLVQASSIESAKRNVDEVLGGAMMDYKILAVSETAIQEVIE